MGEDFAGTELVYNYPEFNGFLGEQRTNLPPILRVERIEKDKLAKSYDEILGLKETDALFEEVEMPEFYGTTAYVNKACHTLPFESRPELREVFRETKGRNVGINVLIKTAKRGDEVVGIISNNESIRRDSYASRLPEIASFAVVVSEPRRLASGQLAMATEFSITGRDLDDTFLTEDDHLRIVYQLLRIGQAYHNAGLAGIDYGKTQILYLTEERFNGEASPRRINLFDFGYWKTLPEDQRVRDKMIVEDIVTEAGVLRDFIIPKMRSSEASIILSKIVKGMLGGEYRSFSEVAKAVDQEGIFETEFDEIIKQG